MRVALFVRSSLFFRKLSALCVEQEGFSWTVRVEKVLYN